MVLGTAGSLTVTVLAWEFTSPLSLDHMKLRLNALWENPWVDGDPAYHGDYFAGKLSAEAVARIYEVENGFVVHLRFLSSAGDARAQLARAEERLLREVLPVLQAQLVHATEKLD